MDRGPKRGLTVHTLEKNLHHSNNKNTEKETETQRERATASVGAIERANPAVDDRKAEGHFT